MLTSGNDRWPRRSFLQTGAPAGTPPCRGLDGPRRGRFHPASPHIRSSPHKRPDWPQRLLRSETVLLARYRRLENGKPTANGCDRADATGDSGDTPSPHASSFLRASQTTSAASRLKPPAQHRRRDAFNHIVFNGQHQLPVRENGMGGHGGRHRLHRSQVGPFGQHRVFPPIQCL